MQAGSVLHLCTKFEADSSIRSKVTKGSRNYEIMSRDPGYAHLGVVLGPYVVIEAPSSVCTKFEADSSFRSKVY